MTWFDLIVLAILALSTGLAVVRGGIKEVGTLVALGVGAGFGLLLLKPLQGLLGIGGSFLATLATGGVLIGVGFLAAYIALHFALERFRLTGRALTADRIGGGVFGFARGLLLVGLGFLAYGYYLDESRWPATVANAASLPVARGVAHCVEGFAPETEELNAAEEEPAPETNAAVEGYDRTDRTALAEIVTTVTTSDRAEADAPGTDEGPETDDGRDAIADLLKEGDNE